MTQLAAPAIGSGSSVATLLAAFLKFGGSTATAVNSGIEGGAASAPNIAPTTVDITNMRANASVGVYAAEAGYGGFVVSEAGIKGLQYSTATLLVATFTTGSAWVVKTSVSPDTTIRVNKPSPWTVNLTATSDNYVYIKADGSVGVATTTVGGQAPTLPTDSLGLSIVTTNGTTVTGTPVDIGPNSAGTLPTNYRTEACWPAATSVTAFTLPPGAFEVNGLSVKLAASQSLAVNISGNFVGGAVKSNLSVYFLVANNSGSPKYVLTSSTPSAVSIVGGATSGTTGVKQFRTIGGLIYRYMGGWPLTSTATLIKGNRIGREVSFISQLAPVANGYTVPTSYSTIGLSRFAPLTAGTARIFHTQNGAVANSWRTSTTGDGGFIMKGNGGVMGVQFYPVLNKTTVTQGAPWFQLKAPSGTASTFCQGYIETLD